MTKKVNLITKKKDRILKRVIINQLVKEMVQAQRKVHRSRKVLEVVKNKNLNTKILEKTMKKKADRSGQ